LRFAHNCLRSLLRFIRFNAQQAPRPAWCQPHGCGAGHNALGHGVPKAFEDQSHGRIVTRAKAYYLPVVVFLDTVLEARRDPFRVTAISHLELCTKSMPGGCVVNLDPHFGDFEAVIWFWHDYPPIASGHFGRA
jgi:hypothetical protein